MKKALFSVELSAGCTGVFRRIVQVLLRQVEAALCIRPFHCWAAKQFDPLHGRV